MKNKYDADFLYDNIWHANSVVHSVALRAPIHMLIETAYVKQ